LSNKWTEYEVELPAGTTYFAIHNVSHDQYYLFIDNVTFEAAPMNVEVTGYDVYVGGGDEWIKLNDEPIDGHTFNTSSLDTEKMLKVATRYSNGYVAMSDPIAIDLSGVDSVAVDGSAEEEYYNLNGIRLGDRPSTPGIYIERRGGESRKVVITR
ncbi:MAG: hypothetical protein HDS75_06840, partial [Bacteroidales bacterium]|nr:hypothetical protein [Bacteroidales bacterium]